MPKNFPKMSAMLRRQARSFVNELGKAANKKAAAAAIGGVTSLVGSLNSAASTKKRVKRASKISVKRKAPYLKKRKTASKTLKKQIKSVLEKERNVGTFHKNYVMDQRMHIIAPNSQNFFSHGKRGNANAAPYTIANCGFTPFDLRKILDAVSVMYNGKIKGFAFDALTNNFDRKGLKIDVQYMSYGLEIKNIAMVPYHVTLYRATAKENLNSYFEDLWAQSINTVEWAGGAPSRESLHNTPFEPMMKKKWNIKATSWVLKPGHSKKFFTNWKGQLNFDKFYDGAAEAIFGKGVSQNWCFVYHPVMGLAGVPTVVDPQTGVMVNDGNATSAGITFEVKEVYRISQPEDTKDAHEGNPHVFYNDYPAAPEGHRVITRWTDAANEGWHLVGPTT